MNRLLIAAILGGLLIGTPTFLTTRAFYQRATLAAKVEASKAQKETSDLKTSLATARADLLVLNQKLSTTLLEERDAEQSHLAIVAASIDDLSKRMPVCASKSDLRIAVAANGTTEAIRNQQQRSLADVIQEFANACGVGRDKDAIDHNKLLKWFQELPKQLPAK